MSVRDLARSYPMPSNSATLRKGHRFLRTQPLTPASPHMKDSFLTLLVSHKPNSFSFSHASAAFAEYPVPASFMPS